MVAIPLVDNPLRGGENLCIDNRRICSSATYPFFRFVFDPRLLEFGARAVVKVVPNVFLVREDLVDGATRPRSSRRGRDTFAVQQRRNFAFRFVLGDEESVSSADGRDFVVRSRRQDDALQLKALPLAGREGRLGITMLIQQESPEAIPGRAALPEAQCYQSALAGKYLGAQVAAELARHSTLQALHDRAHRRIVGGKLF